MLKTLSTCNNNISCLIFILVLSSTVNIVDSDPSDVTDSDVTVNRIVYSSVRIREAAQSESTFIKELDIYLTESRIRLNAIERYGQLFLKLGYNWKVDFCN